MDEIVPVMQPKLPSFNLVAPYLEQMYENRMFSNRGPLLNQLERRLAEMFGSRSSNTVVCANATLAIQGVASIIEMKDLVVPSFTFPATIHAISASQKTVYLEDISPSSWEVNPTTTSKSDGLVRVSAFGSVPKFEDADKWGHLLLDAAASIGSQKYNFSNIPENVTVVFSLHATKVLGIGEGGVVIFGSDYLASEFRKWINFGFDGSRESKILGTNAKLSEMSAAFGLAALDNWGNEKNEWLQSRSYADEVAQRWKITNNLDLGSGINPYWIAKLPSKILTLQLIELLNQKGIGNRSWWGEGCHKMPAFTHMAANDYPHTEHISSTSLGLPFFRGMNKTQFKLIDECLTEIFVMK